jgi:AraC-like DNA-binding protein
MPYRVRSAGRNRRVRYHATMGTYHDDAMLTLVLAGTGWYRTGPGTAAVVEGTLGLVFPGREVGVLMADPADPYDHYYCRFAGSEAMAAARRIAARGGAEPFFPCPEWRQYVDPFERLLSLHADIRGSPPEQVLPIDAALAFLLALIEQGPGIPTHPRLTAESLRTYMRDHLAQPAALDGMAAHFEVSKAHLCRRARALLGHTIVEAWTRMKMEWAAFLLGDEAATVTEVAARAGYDDPFYFSRVFKAHFGASPAAWRRRR